MDHERLEQAPGHTSPSRDEAHTPLPWRAHRAENGQFSIIGADTHAGTWLIAKTLSTSEVDALNAVLIVRAVNSHADLVSALKLLLNHPMTQISEAVELPIRAALSKAETR